jgi:hypothetical protein
VHDFEVFWAGFQFALGGLLAYLALRFAWRRIPLLARRTVKGVDHAMTSFRERDWAWVCLVLLGIVGAIYQVIGPSK